MSQFDSASEYAAEAQRRWPEQVAESNRRLARLSTAEQQALFARGDQIAQALADAMALGATAEAADVQTLVGQHYDWICEFWTPSRDAYVGLGQMYVADERFKARYERIATGLAEFLSEAMRLYANANLD
jgi:hypothetical protein